MDNEEQKQHGVTVGSEIKRESCVIADQAGASIRRACEVIATHLEKDSLKAADMALRIHDAYPSEKREVTHSMTENAMSVAVRVLQSMRSDAGG